MMRISTGDRAQFKQALVDFRAGRGVQNVDTVVDGLLAALGLVRDETPEAGQSATVEHAEGPES